MSDLSDCETFDQALDRVSLYVTGDDLSNELVDVEDLLAMLASKGDTVKLGEVVQAVYDAYVERLAVRDFYAEPDSIPVKFASEAALEVMARGLR